MSRFINTSEGHVNLDHVVKMRVHQTEQAGSVAHITYLEGSAVCQAKADIPFGSELEEYTSPIIPADPGFSVVRIYCEPPPHELYYTPVIAWRVEPGYTHPICAGEDTPRVGDAGAWGIREPKGKVSVPFGRTYDTAEEFARDQIAKLIRKQSKRNVA